MYTRFITKALHRMGLIGFDEPFKKFFAHGLIIKDGVKMSKSKGNVINPDEYIEKYGADALRMYLMFIGPLDGGGDFTDNGIVAMRKFISRAHGLVSASATGFSKNEPSEERKRAANSAIESISSAMDQYKYNVAISKVMIYLRHLQSITEITEAEIEILLKSLSVFCPYVTEELWIKYLGRTGSVHSSGWPKPFALSDSAG
jgi:leucyl-tRNA synthetase